MPLCLSLFFYGPHSCEENPVNLVAKIAAEKCLTVGMQRFIRTALYNHTPPPSPPPPLPASSPPTHNPCAAGVERHTDVLHIISSLLLFLLVLSLPLSIYLSLCVCVGLTIAVFPSPSEVLIVLECLLLKRCQCLPLPYLHTHSL